MLKGMAKIGKDNYSDNTPTYLIKKKIIHTTQTWKTVEYLMHAWGELFKTKASKKMFNSQECFISHTLKQV